LLVCPPLEKTTTAKWLAHKMEWTFLDLDEYIESKMGMSVRDIFSTMGEDSFRELEAKCLRETSNLRDVVIGCGGGTAAFHGNMDWMKAHGLTVFLNTSFDILVQRIAKNDSERPLFQGCDKEEIMKKLSEIAEKRSIYYGSAKIIWNKSEPSDFLYRAVNQLVSIN
jgi:shikimate kinase